MKNGLELTFNPTILTPEFCGVSVNGTTDYDDLKNKPSVNGIELQGGENTIPIPSKTSDLRNDSGFITLADLPIYNGGVS